MQKILKLIPLLAVLALLSLAPACNTTPQKVAFTTATTVQASVETVMNAWHDYVIQFHPSDSFRAQVKQAYIRYQNAMVVAIDTDTVVAELSSSTNAPAGAVADAQAKQSAAYMQAAQALADLTALVKSFGAKL